VFRVVIVRFNLMTPGREAEPVAAAPIGAAVPRAEGFIAALGGPANLVSVDACTTRLRLQVAEQGSVDEAALKALGSRGLVRPSPKDLQVVLGPQADDVAREMRDALALSAQDRAAPAAAPSPKVAEGPDAAQLVAALGGAGNVQEVQAASSRIRVVLRRAGDLDEAKLRALGVRALARTASGAIHLIVGPAAGPLGAAMGAIVG
jgi:N-acetylglucosamine PTS system EIICBA or EIICB component